MDEIQAITRFDLPKLGLWSLSVEDAARLIVVDMYYSGYINETFDIEPENEKDPILIKYLSRHIDRHQRLLIKSIERGELKTEYVRRNLDDEIVLNNTYINFSSIRGWMESHGSRPGDIISDWAENEFELEVYIANEITQCRRALLEGKDVFDDAIYGKDIYAGNDLEKTEKYIKMIDDAMAKGIPPAVIFSLMESDEDKPLGKYQRSLYSSWKRKNDIIHSLNRKIIEIENISDAQEGPPLSTRNKKTFIAIISALCKEARLDPKERGMAKRISCLTEKIGVPVSDDTIKKILDEVTSETNFSRIK